MSGIAASADQRARADLAGDVAQLHTHGKQHAEIGEARNLSTAQDHKILSELFVEGMRKLKLPVERRPRRPRPPAGLQSAGAGGTR